jgi:eukaryotic-like serine/threonine-protein kinase
MKSKKIVILSALLIIISIILSACSSSVYSSTSWHGLTIGTDVAYLSAGTQAYAVDLATGAQKWKFPSDKPNAKGFYANPVLTTDGTQLLVPSYDHKLYNVNPDNGTEIWETADLHNRLIASPLIIDNTIYQPSADGNVYAINLKDGSLAWAEPASTGTDPLWAQPVTVATCNCIYVAAMNHKVYKFDIASGRELRVSDDLNGSIIGTPAISADGSVLYVGTFGSELLALNTNDLSVKWRFTTQDWVWAGPGPDRLWIMVSCILAIKVAISMQ